MYFEVTTCADILKWTIYHPVVTHRSTILKTCPAQRAKYLLIHDLNLTEAALFLIYHLSNDLSLSKILLCHFCPFPFEPTKFSNKLTHIRVTQHYVQLFVVFQCTDFLFYLINVYIFELRLIKLVIQ